MSGDVGGDNRFELIKKYKQRLIEGTNIESRPEEMVVLDSILFRFWQMGWLEDVELKKVELDTAYECGKNANKWIPVSERLPEEGARVLISLKLKRTKKVVRSATYFGEGCFHSDTGDFWNTQQDVELLAWMPLPKPYKVESEG